METMVTSQPFLSRYALGGRFGHRASERKAAFPARPISRRSVNYPPVEGINPRCGAISTGWLRWCAKDTS